ncbi:MAG: L,D-transpeptidase family protein [Candidatus Omnitrophica bacterium]|nr:L,D-transpeptidase family protein [Candidatus Omnitrophota bacterium]MDD5436918.1 L,D-transpeptidase family protein [Candidatus Omnitrophota bacterium]
MNKNVIVVALIVILTVIAAFLAYGIVMHGRTAKPAGESAESKPVERSAAGESESEYLAAASNYEKKLDLVKAKESYQKMIEKYPGSNNISKTQEALESLNIKLLFSPTITPDSFAYEVQKGDTLTKIAKKFGTTTELISRANGLKNATVKIGKKLKISKAKFSIIVDKSQNILTLKADQDILKTYKVSTGKDSCTPIGTFKVTNKLIDPPWYPSAGGMIPAGDPKNVLGSRWIGLSKQGYGIHGTTDPGSIGKSVTEGCVRMINSEVEELYSIVPIGTEVVIVD